MVSLHSVTACDSQAAPRNLLQPCFESALRLVGRPMFTPSPYTDPIHSESFAPARIKILSATANSSGVQGLF
jgi:hypothetical protein